MEQGDVRTLRLVLSWLPGRRPSGSVKGEQAAEGVDPRAYHCGALYVRECEDRV